MLFFGKIEYLNLLPFHVYLKKALRYSGQKQTLEYYKDVPSHINHLFQKRRVDAAFISSIKAQKCTKPQLGIVAKKEVKSVLVLPNSEMVLDGESETSNTLAQLLGLKGRVLIGDKALRYALKDGAYIDMAQVWHERYGLPFVFAVLCHHNKTPLLKRLQNGFYHEERYIKIPRYLLEKAAKKSGVSAKDILNYLSLITYKISYKEEKSLKLFYKKAKSKNL